MVKRSVVFAMGMVLAVAPGCSKKEGGDGAAKPADTAKAGDTAAGGEAAGGGAAAAGPVELTKLGLKMDAPAGSNVSDGVVGGQMVQGPGLVVSVDEAKESSPATLEAQKEDASMYSPKNYQEETLPDGWAVTFENTGGAGTNYWVVVRREIGGKAYRCETTAASAEQQANALAACKSLKQ